LVQCFFFLAPLEILMVFAGTTELAAGMVAGGAIGSMGLILLASSRLRFSLSDDRPVAYLLLFLIIGVVSTSLTVYGRGAIEKGAINLSAMFAMVLMTLVIKQTLIQWPQLCRHIGRITAITTGLAGLTVIFQSIVSNVLNSPELFDLSFLNSFWGRNWWRFTQQEGLVRAQGIYAEPSFLAVYLGMGAGLAMTRLGLFGVKWRAALRGTVPLWAACSILASMALSFSALTYGGLLACFLGALAAKTRFRFRSLLFLFVGGTVALLVLALLAVQLGDIIIGRIMGLAVLSQLDATSGVSDLDNDINLTVQVLFLNAYVTLRNVIANPFLGAGVGAHPFAYAALLPAVAGLPGSENGVVGINAQDAAALSLRLLSETGILGTLVFTIAILSAWFRVRREIVKPDDNLNSDGSSYKAMAIGWCGGLVGVFAAMLAHVPHYYGPELWAVIAMCCSLPALISLARLRPRRSPHIPAGGA
jgi:O-antigen ligase